MNENITLRPAEDTRMINFIDTLTSHPEILEKRLTEADKSDGRYCFSINSNTWT